jgi:hypothetical protein
MVGTSDATYNAETYAFFCLVLEQIQAGCTVNDDGSVDSPAT